MSTVALIITVVALLALYGTKWVSGAVVQGGCILKAEHA